MVTFKVMAKEFDGAEEMLEGDALSALFEVGPNGGELAVVEGAVKLKVELNTGEVEVMTDEALHVEAWVGDALLGEVFAAAINHIKNGRHSGRREATFCGKGTHLFWQ